MMESADNPKLDFPPSCKVRLDEEVDSAKISVSDQPNGLQYTTKSESFVIDVDSFSSGTGKEISQNSRITRDFSRKGLLRGSNKITQDYPADTTDSITPTGGAVEKQAFRELLGGSSSSPQSHQIAITGAERWSFRRNSMKRGPQASWYLDPRKIFMLCATLSCVGSMLLIYFAFWSGMLGEEESDQLDY